MSDADNSNNNSTGSDGGNRQIILPEIIPAQYWRSRGYSNYYSEVLVQRFQDQLIRLISRGRWSRDNNVSIGYDYRSDFRIDHVIQEHGDVSLVEHDDVLLPLWVACTKALRKIDCHAMKSITLFNIELNEVVSKYLAHALEDKRLNCLAINNVRLGRHGINAFAVKVVESNSTLTRLELFDTPINYLDAATNLFSVIQDHPTLEKVSLHDCNIGSNLELLGIIMEGSKKIQHLVLSNNDIGPEGSNVIANYLKQNPPLETIFLGRNKMKDEGVIQLALALKTNTNLKSLSIYSSGMAEVGSTALLQAALDTSSLDSIRDSNHTCQIYHDLRDEFLDFTNRVMLQGLSNVDLVVQQKVLFALGNEGRLQNIQCISDVQTEFIPILLKFVQNHLDSHHSFRDSFQGRRAVKGYKQVQKGNQCILLTNVFEVTRNCVAPILFCA